MVEPCEPHGENMHLYVFALFYIYIIVSNLIFPLSTQLVAKLSSWYTVILDSITQLPANLPWSNLKIEYTDRKLLAAVVAAMMSHDYFGVFGLACWAAGAVYTHFLISNLQA